MTTDHHQGPDAMLQPTSNGRSGPVAVFEHAWLVHVVVGDATSPDAQVDQLVPMRVSVRHDRITADGDGLDWSWLVDDVGAVVHGRDAGWSIISAFDVDGFGVAVDGGDVARFRAAIADIAGLDSVLQTPPAGSEGFSSLASPVWAPPVVDDGLSAPAEPVVFVKEPDVDLASQGLQRPRRGLWRVAADPAAVHPAGLASLEARNISAWFGDHLVLDRVSLDMPAGEVTALIGPSGCGKSTFLRIMNRMHEMIPSASMAGEVVLDGHDIYDPERKVTEARVEIGMVFQKPNPFPAMSIYDNVLASLRVTGTKASAEVKDSLVESCLAKAGLWTEVKDRLRQPGGGLSGGQQQRLCIARALAIKPRVLLMDEPCSALDPTSTRRIEETITELVSEVTIVIVTHNMQQAVRVSNRCAFFLAEHNTPGYIVEHGPTDAMFNAPQDPRTFDYVNGRFG